MQLSLNNGQTVFRQGEIIALTAEYSSSSDKKYYFNTRGYDRSGRLSGMEVFCIDPSVGEDPLSDYFNGGMGFLGGGLGSEQDLSKKPYSISLELNEWISLPTGSYRLSIVSHRVTLPTETSPNGLGSPTIPLRSNKVEFRVVKAEPEWQLEQLAAAESAFDSSDSDDAKRAARVLRFLGSEEATRELARRFWSGNEQPFGWDLKFGLFGSRHRATAIEVMKDELKDPQHPVTQEFVQTLATLEMQSDPKSRFPKYDEKNQEAWTKSRDAYYAAFNKHVADYLSITAGMLPAKTVRAQAVTVSELLQSKEVVLDEVTKTQLRQMLVASWEHLPLRRRNELIQYRWEQVGGPELLPILRRIVNGESNPNHCIDKPERAPALRRIYELTSVEGRELIVHEVANPKGDIGIDVLGMLPDRELPGIEQPLIAKMKLGNANDVDYQLLQRYASVRALPDVKALYEAHRGEWACVPQDAMLRYFLRVKPDYGVAQVSDALGRRKATGCYKFQLTGLSEDIRRPKLEKIAIAALNDISPEVVENAAEALGHYGSAKAEAALWVRLEKFHEQWKDRADELRYRLGANPDMLLQVRLEQVLVQTIADGQGWFASEDKIEAVKGLASPQMQPELDGVLQEIRRGEWALNLNWWPDGTLSYSVGRYTGKGIAALEEKLAQLPLSTHLNVVTTVAELARHRTEFDAVQDAAAANSLVLQIQTPR